MSYTPNLQLRTLAQLIEDFAGPLPEQIKMTNMIYSLGNMFTPPVLSVNGQTGAVVLDASDVGALPDTYEAPVTSVNGKDGVVVLEAADVGAADADDTVNLTGAQTVAGVKTFSDAPKVPAVTDRDSAFNLTQLYANKLFKQAAHVDVAANATLTPAQMVGGIIVVDTTAAVINVTLPTGSALEPYLNSLYGQVENGDAFIFRVMNINGTNGSKLVANTGITFVGSTDIGSWFYALCIARRTATNTYTVYRV